jgi:hypothetical protein
MWMVAVLAALAAGVSTSQTDLDKVLQYAAPVHAAFARVELEQAAMPRPKDDAERLVRLQAIDQAGRDVLSHTDLTKIPPSYLVPAGTVAMAEINAHDAENQAALRRMLPPSGWFSISVYGPDAAKAAFLIVQHGPADLQREALHRMAPLLGSKEIDGRLYATLYDRIALAEDHQPQRYGTGVVCRNGAWAPDRLEDPAGLDARRKAMGFTQSEQDYVASFSHTPCLLASHGD